MSCEHNKSATLRLATQKVVNQYIHEKKACLRILVYVMSPAAIGNREDKQDTDRVANFSVNGKDLKGLIGAE